MSSERLAVVIPDIQYQLTNCSFGFGKEPKYLDLILLIQILSLFTSLNLFPVPNNVLPS